MTLRIGIVGVGVVGGAILHGFNKLGHTVLKHDPKLNTKLSEIKDTEIAFLCVPTLALENGRCDTTIVEQTVRDLSELGYTGVIAIKSTVEPGTTALLDQQYPALKLCFVPEFLRERCAITDFCENHDLCVIGTADKGVFDLVKAAHGHYPRKFVQTSQTEAELVKYFNNAYNATLIMFANNFYELSQKLGVDYTTIKNAVVTRDHINDRYLECNENIRGFGGVCLPKDLNALAYLARKHGTLGTMFQNLLDDNSKYKTTVFEGMRKNA